MKSDLTIRADFSQRALDVPRHVNALNTGGNIDADLGLAVGHSSKSLPLDQSEAEARLVR